MAEGEKRSQVLKDEGKARSQFPDGEEFGDEIMDTRRGRAPNTPRLSTVEDDDEPHVGRKGSHSD